jgi:hypothetical protein
MMKNLILLTSCLLLSIGGFAQARKVRGNGNVVTKDKRIEAFTKVIVEDGLDVTLLNNPFQNKIAITADANLHQIIDSEISNGVLTIKIKDGIEIINKTENFKVSITSKDIESFTIKGNSNLVGTGVNEILKLSLINEGSGSVNLKVKTDELKAVNNGSGTITAEGSSNLVSIKNAGSGNTNLDTVSTFFLEVDSSGSGNVYTNAVNGIDGTLSGSGNIYYKNTKTVNIETTGSGQVLRQ